MTVFGREYSKAYDLLYREKDYDRECDFLETIFRKSGRKVQSVLDLGCGTGGHAVILGKRGYKVTGVDRSAEMIGIAEKKSKEAGVKVSYHKSPIQDLRLDRKFDAVISMFAVMSYQIDNKDLASACRVARAHLKNNGMFIFDAWHGLAVMTDPPTERIKEVKSKTGRIIRITKPDLNALSHTVDTHFKVLNFDKNILTSETDETHTMRFLFPQEIRYFLESAGFSKVQFCPFMKPNAVLSAHDWNMTVIAG